MLHAANVGRLVSLRNCALVLSHACQRTRFRRYVRRQAQLGEAEERNGAIWSREVCRGPSLGVY